MSLYIWIESVCENVRACVKRKLEKNIGEGGYDEREAWAYKWVWWILGSEAPRKLDAFFYLKKPRLQLN